MKTLALALFLSTAASAEVVKTCNTRMQSMGSVETVEMRFEILREGGVLKARMTQPQVNEFYDEVARIADFPVRAGLQAMDLDDMLSEDPEDMAPNDYNMGENLIVHAMTLEESEKFGGQSRSGILLANVRSVRAYLIGEPEDEIANVGVTAIVEAKDARSRVLGSFLGGLTVSPCR